MRKLVLLFVSVLAAVPMAHGEGNPVSDNKQTSAFSSKLEVIVSCIGKRILLLFSGTL